MRLTTEREQVLKIGPLEVQAEQQKSIPLPDVLGWAALGAGVVLLIAAMRRRQRQT